MTDGAGKGATAEQRRRDGRLAWTIVLACGALSLTVMVLGALALRGSVMRLAETSMRQSPEQMERRQVEREAMFPPQPPSVSLLPTLPAKPVGSVASWIGPVDYPTGALRRGEEGRVSVIVTVDDDGSATGCSVDRSSGFYSLDNGTCAVLMRNGRWTVTAPGAHGVRRWTSPLIRWQLPA